jgi:hypothetical protein
MINIKIMKDFDKIEGFDFGSKNKLSIGYKGKSKFFIKEYVVRKGREADDLLKVRCEILCYKNIKSLKLPEVLKSDYKKRVLILEFVNFDSVKISKSNIDKIIKLYLEKIIKTDAPFLPRVTYRYYSGSLYKRAKKLASQGIIKNLGRIYRFFEENKTLINKSAKYFSHGDLHFGNIKYLDNELTITDLEHARRDNKMYDLASVYADLYKNKKLAKYFLKKIKKMKFFDNDLFLLMVFRRCIEVIYGSRNNPKSEFYKSAKELINLEPIAN